MLIYYILFDPVHNMYIYIYTQFNYYSLFTKMYINLIYQYIENEENYILKKCNKSLASV